MPPAPIFVPLPLRGAPDAPAFDGNPQNLFRYFADIEHICANVGIVPADDLLIACAIRYLDYNTADLWDCAHLRPSLLGSHSNPPSPHSILVRRIPSVATSPPTSRPSSPPLPAPVFVRARTSALTTGTSTS